MSSAWDASAYTDTFVRSVLRYGKSAVIRRLIFHEMTRGPTAELPGQPMRDGCLAWIDANTQAGPAMR